MSKKLKRIALSSMAVLMLASISPLESNKSVHHVAHASTMKLKNMGYKQHVINNMLKDTASQAGGYGYRTTGGKNALQHRVSVYTTQQLRKALKKKSAPKYIIIRGHLDGNIDAKTSKMMTAKDYAKGTGYSFNKYRNAISSSRISNNANAQSQESALKKAASRQKHNVEFHVPSNTTIVGAPGSQLKNINFVLNGHNDVLRNLTMQAPIDYFPAFDPNDGKLGNWNSQYDAISVKGAKNVWLDHNTLTDGSNIDSMPSRKTFGRQYQQHDGLADITDGADDITVSNNRFTKHDKVMLIGSSDKQTSDKGKLHVTVEHNTFDNTVQRMPRVRYGHVNIKDNIFKNNGKNPYKFSYAFGYGKDAHISADHNYFLGKNARNMASKHLIQGLQGKSLSAKNNYANGREYSIKLKGHKIIQGKTGASKMTLKSNSITTQAAIKGKKAHPNKKLITDSVNNGAATKGSKKDHQIINKAMKKHTKMPKTLQWLANCIGI